MSIEIPKEIIEAAEKSKIKQKKLNVGIIKGIDIYYEGSIKDEFCRLIHMNNKRVKRIFLKCQEFKELNEVGVLSDEDYKEILKDL